MWHLPGSGLEPTAAALAGGFFTTEPPGKPWCLAPLNPQLLRWHLPLPSPPLVTTGFPVNRFPFFVILTSLFLRFHISDTKVFVFLKLVLLRILLSKSIYVVANFRIFFMA